MTNRSTFRFRVVFIIGVLAGSAASAQISGNQIARLGADLTPLGAERAGNADDSIPEWTGGIVNPPDGYILGEHHRDPYAHDQPLFVIDIGNVDQYRRRLSFGHQKMLRDYPNFEMQVYPTKRSASAPQRIYDATRRIAPVATLVDNGNGVSHAAVGIPFPIPANGLHVIWNHLLRYRGESVACTIGQAAVSANGHYTLVKNRVEAKLNYWLPGMASENLGNKMFMLKQKVIEPAGQGGERVLVHETMNQVREPRNAWTYRPGKNGLRRSPNIAYDAYGPGTDKLRTTDQADMFNGAINRYEWRLLGKREMYVPYNAYKLHSDALKFSDILMPHHPNSIHLRYELHRVWVVESRLKEGAQHIYRRRILYIDEDSWSILVADIFDSSNRLWRMSEAHVINYYEKPLIWTTLEVHSDLREKRYFVYGLDNEFSMCTWDENSTSRKFTPKALREWGDGH